MYIGYCLDEMYIHQGLVIDANTQILKGFADYSSAELSPP